MIASKKLFVGLGNPGKDYEKTRHNYGFLILDSLAKELGAKDWKQSDKFQAEVADAPGGILLAKPQTFMNNSGLSVKKLAAYYQVAPENILVFHDEVDLPFGEFRIQKGRGPAGHNGVKSLISELGTKDFYRVRLGVGKSDQIPTDAYVLQKFTKDELAGLKAVFKEVAELI
jgi:PTH1 family peptidyl-tRNA hydrolase